MARYSVLHHEVPHGSGRENHFDLLLEHGESLATWELAHWPPLDAQTARRLPDHRKTYLEFEGSLTDNRGHVRRIGEGTFRIISRTDQQWVISLVGKEFSGTIRIGKARTTDKPPTDQCWIVSLESATD